MKLNCASCRFESCLSHHTYARVAKLVDAGDDLIAGCRKTQAIPQRLSIAAFAGSSAGEKLPEGRWFESSSRLHYGAVAQRKSVSIKLTRRLKSHRRFEVAAYLEARHSLDMGTPRFTNGAERQGSRSALSF